MKNTSAILIADSLPDNISALNSLLADKFTIYEANNLDELFSSLKKNVNIAVLILNVSLVHGKADVFIKAFKSNPLFSHIQIILLSYEITTGLEKTSLSADGAYFLHMPYSSPSLITECVNKAVNALHDVTVKNFINDVEDNPMYLGSMTKLLPCGIATFEVKNDHVITTAFNDAFCAMSNRTREEYLDYVKDDTLNIVYQEDRKVLLKDFYTSLRENKDIHTACRFIDKSGQIKWSKITARVFGSKNGTINCIATFLDVTEEKKINELLQYQTEHDELTGVLNRETFFKKTAEMLKSKVNVQHVLLRTNIENLKVVNEMLGSETGDRMLKAVVKELSKWVDDDGTLGRLHSDHFVACMPLKHFNISYIKKRLPHIFDELNINYNAIVSIGIYEITDINVPISQMCDRAYLSMATIKGNYVKRYAYYDNKMRETLLHEQETISEMDEALAERQFKIYLQPIYDSYTQTMSSAETLVRWQHPVKGLILPSYFIPLFERNGFITQLDRYVWEETCAFLHDRMDKGQHVVPVSVNISRMNFYSPDLTEFLKSLIKKYNIMPFQLRLEITESAYAENPEQLLKALKTLRDCGFKICMDDFGSGYSSLNMLMDTQIDIIKFDKRFVQELATSSRASNLLGSIVRMAKWLAIEVIAEGVETKEQFDYLRSIGCDNIQGFYFSDAMPEEKFAVLLDNYKPATPAPSSALVSNLEKLNYDAIWNAKPELNVLFNIVGGLGLYQLTYGSLELIRANDAYFKLLCSNNNCLLRNAYEKVHEEDKHLLLDSCLAAKSENIIKIVDIRRYHDDGHLMNLEIRIKYLCSNNNSDLFIFSFIDITGQQEPKTYYDANVQTESQLQGTCTITQETHIANAEDYRLRFLASHTNSMVLEWNIKTGKSFADSAAKGYLIAAADPHELVNGINITKYIYPADEDEFLSFITGGNKGNQSDLAEADLRLKTNNGTYVWCHVTSTRIKDSDGMLKTILMIIENIDEEKKEHIALIDSRIKLQKSMEDMRRQSELYHILLDASQTIIFDYDPMSDLMIHSILQPDNNREQQIVSGYMNYLPHNDIIHHDYTDIFIDAIKKATVQEVSSQLDYLADYYNTGYRWYRLFYRSIANTSGKVFRVVGRIDDINDEVINTKKLINSSERDSLTKLYNRATSENVVNKRLVNLLPGQSAALMIIDIDEFKEVNDSHGHLIGDAFLQEVAKVLQHQFRDNDIVGRIGGDEFIVFMSGLTDLGIVSKKAKNVLQAICNIRVTELDNVTCCIGIAVTNAHNNDTYESLLPRADKALYAAKAKHGKNNFILYDDINTAARDKIDTAISDIIDSDVSVSPLENSLSAYVFNTLYQINDIKKAVNLVLKEIGLRFNVNRAFIFETKNCGATYSNTYEWCNKGISPMSQTMQNVSLQQYFGMNIEALLGPDGIYNSQTAGISDEILHTLEKEGIKGVLFCAIYAQQHLAGFVGFDNRMQNSEWTKEQADILSFTAKLLGIFLFKASDIHS
jgi:diguanylate cyclase (GGDEF)-like protein